MSVSRTEMTEMGLSPCRCGRAWARKSPGWACQECFPGRGGVAASPGLRSGAGRNPVPPLAGTGSGVVATHPAPSKPMPGRHARGDAVCDALAESMRLAGIPSVEREFKFHPVRRWRFDIVARAHSLAVEVDGGAFTGGHSRGAAYAKECQKFNEAVLCGWRVLRVTPGMVKDGTALALVRRAIGGQ